jgi:hypothetical protein
LSRQVTVVAILGLALGACGVYGPKGNDTGGIIPWSPENELAAHDIAQNNCGRYDAVALITSIHREYGDYIAYECRTDAPRRMR